MKRFSIISVFLLFSTTFLFPFEPVATTDNVLSTIVNPAGLGFKRTFEGYIISPFDTSGFMNETSFFLRAGNLGFGSSFYGEQENYNSFILASGFSPMRNLYVGSGYKWFTKVKKRAEWNVGLLYRPQNYLSLGLTGKNINSANGTVPLYNLGLGIRPIGNRFTISVDGNLNKTDSTGYGGYLNLRFSTEFEPISGFIFKTNFSKDNFGIGIGFNLRHFGIETYGNLNDVNELNKGKVVTHFSIDRYRTVFRSKRKYWVTLTLMGSIIEEKRKTGIFTKRNPTLKDILDIIEKLGDDPEVKGIYLIIEGPQCGFAKMQEIRKALLEFKKNGKRIYCYSQSLDNKDYYLATVADSIFMNPSGELNLIGLLTVTPFFKGTLDKIGIEAELEHIGKYKSASDIFTQDSMTPAHKEVTNAILDNIYSQLTKPIADARGMGIQHLMKLIDKGPYTAKEAKNVNLVDELLYEDEVGERLRKKHTKIVSLGRYIAKKDYVYDWQLEPVDKIAIIYATGNIVSGNSSTNFFSGNLMGSKTIVKAIRDARKDKRVKAIVLRIDSGGGSGIASDVIWREVKKTTKGKNRKPFVVSMSDVAGSGGYYIACAADIILADEGTITGSIGVVGGKFNFEEFYKKIGLRFETTKRGKHAGMFSSTKSFSDEERELLRKEIKEFYQDFIEKVAEGRDLPVSKVDSIGKGRIWTGNQAKEIGLVDEIGGLKEAIKIAKRKAGLSEDRKVAIEIYPKYRFFSLFNLGSSGVINLKSSIPEELFQVLIDMSKYCVYEDENILYIMPYTIQIK